jgi:subtilase family serine protease
MRLEQPSGNSPKKEVQRDRLRLGAIKPVFYLGVVLMMLFIVACLGRPQPGTSEKAAQKKPHRIQFSTVYVPDTDLSKSGTIEGFHTTYRLAADPSNRLPLVVASDSVDTDVLKNIRSVYGVPDGGGSGFIAVVVAYNHPSAREDLAAFSRKFNLPVCTDAQCLEIIPPLRSVSDGPCSWSREAALGLQWAHAMAPKANLILVEADSHDKADMFAAVDRATKRLLALGGGEVDLPWGKLEGADIGPVDIAKFDKVFADGVVYLASSGDSGHVVSYPASSAKVVAIGGTTFDFDDNGAFLGEGGWPGTGGGHSQFIAKPGFQNGIENTSPNRRSMPDLALNAGYVPVFNSTACDDANPGWQYIQGTSVSVALAAGLVNTAGHNHATATELKNLYANRKDVKKIRDIVDGTAPGCCAKNYDTFTGVGAPAGLQFDAP